MDTSMVYKNYIEKFNGALQNRDNAFEKVQYGTDIIFLYTEDDFTNALMKFISKH